MKLVTAILVKNEADRYLRRVVQRCLEFSDKVLVLDDRSADSTVKVAKELGCVVRERSVLKEPMWGAEAPARAELWSWAVEEAGDGWVLVCDADMILHGDPRPLCASWEVNAWCWPLFDLWDEAETLARVDSFWAAGPTHARPWLFCPTRVPEGWQPEWPKRGLHPGHCPANFPIVPGVAPQDTYWLHLAYCKKPDRLAKHHAYMAHKDKLTPFEVAHAASIIEAWPSS